MRSLGFRVIAGLTMMIVASIMSFVSRIGMVSVPATVSVIDRKCTFVSGSDKHEYDDDCSSSDEWDSVRANKSKQNIVGNADVTINYTSPKDQSYQTAHLHLTSKNDAFFSLSAGDTVDVLVNPDKPERAILD